jgi:hypothetical protein
MRAAIFAALVMLWSGTEGAEQPSGLAGDDVAIQGTWRGTGRSERFTLVFRGDVLMGRVGTDPIVAPMVSHFRLDQANGTIDIERQDGMQLGRFSITGDTLTLTLADVGRFRPKTLERSLGDRSSQRFVFERQ